MMPLMISLNKEKVNNKELYVGEIQMLRDMFSLFVVDLEALDKNLWLLSQRSKGGLPIGKIENIPFWRYESFVSIANKLAKDEDEKRKAEEEKQKTNSPSNPGSYLNKMSSMANKFKK